MNTAAPVNNGPRTITLIEPIERKRASDGAVVETITEIKLRRLKLGDLVAAMDAGGDNAKGTMMLHLAARSCGLPLADVAELGMEDGAAVLEAVAGFMPAGLRPGTTGST